MASLAYARLFSFLLTQCLPVCYAAIRVSRSEALHDGKAYEATCRLPSPQEGQ